MLSTDGSNALVWDAERLRIATDAAGIALWEWNVDTNVIALDERAHGLWGVRTREGGDGVALAGFASRVQHNGIALLQEEPGRHLAQAIRRSGDENPSHDGNS